MAAARAEFLTHVLLLEAPKCLETLNILEEMS